MLHICEEGTSIIYNHQDQSMYVQTLDYNPISFNHLTTFGGCKHTANIVTSSVLYWPQVLGHQVKAFPRTTVSWHETICLSLPSHFMSSFCIGCHVTSATISNYLVDPVCTGFSQLIFLWSFNLLMLMTPELNIFLTCQWGSLCLLVAKVISIISVCHFNYSQPFDG